ncbi:MAG: hypothetical protein HQK65_22210 [Desulfamplus sp.]|nr:hypothetical protein [Desulfamplus sp.]
MSKPVDERVADPYPAKLRQERLNRFMVLPDQDREKYLMASTSDNIYQILENDTYEILKLVNTV